MRKNLQIPSHCTVYAVIVDFPFQVNVYQYREGINPEATENFEKRWQRKCKIDLSTFFAAVVEFES